MNANDLEKKIPLSNAERQRKWRATKRKDAVDGIEQNQPKPSKLASQPMPCKPRQQRSDSVTAEIAAMANVNKSCLMPPLHVTLSNDAYPYWVGIIESRARDAWTVVDLVTAAGMAKCQAFIASEELLLEQEGSLSANASGAPMLNPRITAIELHYKRVFAQMRALRMGGKAAGELGGLVGGRILEGDARKTNSGNDDDLLA